MIIIKYFDIYVPLNQNTNSFRHYGFKFDKILFFELHELLHIINSDIKEDYPAYIKAYFELKSKYNLLRSNNDLSVIIPFNKYLYKEFVSLNKYYIDKYIKKNSSIVDWNDMKEQEYKRLDNKEMLLYKTLSTKLCKHENYFKKISEEVETFVPLHTNSIQVTEPPSYSSCLLFKIIEDFNNFNITFPSIDNSVNYLKCPVKANEEMNLLNYFKFFIYYCRADFNRNKDEHLAEILFVNKYVKIKELTNEFKNKVICVISNNDYVILHAKEIKLDFTISDKHIKKRKI